MAYSITGHALHLDGNKVHSVPSSFVGGRLPSPTRIAVIHFTYGGTALSSANWFQSSSNPGSSAHVVVDRDGSTVQCVPFDKVAWHAGRSRWKNLVGLNNHSIGIELANWGYLQPISGGWECYTGIRISNPMLAVHKNGNPNGGSAQIGWEPYPEVQFKAATGIVRALVEAYGIDEIIGHDDISPDRKWDPGPAFDMVRFRSRVFGERSQTGDIRMQVAIQEGLNLRRGPGTEHDVVTLLAQGTEVEPIERRGKWLCVTVIGPAGTPTLTGWLHSSYLA
jgi:N-acetylmuramoyl-L-alanine amidase